MKIALIILFALYIFKLFKNREKEKKEFYIATNELDNNIVQILGSEKLQNVKNKNIWQGMPECLLQYVVGKPIEITERETPNVIYKTWYYRQIPEARSNARRKYKTEIYTENNFITHWDILN